MVQRMEVGIGGEQRRGEILREIVEEYEVAREKLPDL